ncbi:MAG TPA: hypothetical protein VGP24_06740 [Glaciihabitans sp.]|jgi:uncharacterized membrane-anchored protein|nr:hypothetical protein [Glaciihabitans sp.]
MKEDSRKSLENVTAAKVPAVTAGFWIAKVAATTLGETGGDWVTMSLKLGYLVGTAIFAAIFVGLVLGQVKASRFNRFLYWATIVATTTLGTTMADFFDRSLGVGYPGGTAIIGALLIGSLLVWHRVEGTVSIQSITTARAEWFYWCTILFSQTLGTALGDWTAGNDRGGLGLGYEHAALIFGGALLVIAALYFWTQVSRTLLFWMAFVLTRPLGATVGDFLDKPLAQGGLQLSRFYASLALLVVMVLCVLLFPQRAARSGRVP